MRLEDTWIVKKLDEYKIREASTLFDFLNYGRMDDANYSAPIIQRNISEFYVFASDGKRFDTDLIARSNYEGKLK
jgi:hypothetical protein